MVRRSPLNKDGYWKVFLVRVAETVVSAIVISFLSALFLKLSTLNQLLENSEQIKQATAQPK